MKNEALRLVDELESLGQYVPSEAPAMIRRLVEELDKQNPSVFTILTCGCKSSFMGFPSEWDGETREFEPCVNYGSLCEQHFMEYEARPAQYTPQTKPLSDEEIWELHQEHIDEIPCGHSMKTIGFVEFARAIEERHGIK
jgi:hypothetical protein